MKRQHRNRLQVGKLAAFCICGMLCIEMCWLAFRIVDEWCEAGVGSAKFIKQEKSQWERDIERERARNERTHIFPQCVWTAIIGETGKNGNNFEMSLVRKAHQWWKNLWWWENEQCAKAHLPLASMCQKYLAWRIYETQLEFKRMKWTWFFYFSPATSSCFATRFTTSSPPTPDHLTVCAGGVSAALGSTRVNDSPSNSSN